MEKESKHFSHWHPLPKSYVYVEHEQDKAKEKINMIWNFFWAWSNMILTIDLETLFKVTAHPLTNALCGWSRARLEQGEITYDPDKAFSDIYAMTLRLDL